MPAPSFQVLLSFLTPWMSLLQEAFLTPPQGSQLPALLLVRGPLCVLPPPTPGTSVLGHRTDRISLVVVVTVTDISLQILAS